jgi:hypothetical protein
VLDVLASTTARLGAAPRRIAYPRDVISPPKPAWLGIHDGLWKAEAARPWLIQHGRLVRGWLVMANDLLFHRGERAYPGLVLYAPAGDVDAESLEEIATAVFEMRGRELVAPQLAALAAELAKPAARPFDLRVPPAVARGHDVRIGSLVIHRKHLPRPYLAAPLLPILVHAEAPAVTLLPAPLWADDLRDAWLELAAEP